MSAETTTPPPEATSAAETRVTMCHIVEESDLVPADNYADEQSGPPLSKHHRRRRRHLNAGFLLRLMDACACASAEKFSGRSSVTLSLDDVTFEDPTLAPGEVLTVRSQVNCAWNTSLEAGVLCDAEDLVQPSTAAAGKKRRICRAFLTFVALDENGKKTKLPPLRASSDACIRRQLTAEERRQIRFRRGDIINRNAAIPTKGDSPAASASPRELPQADGGLRGVVLTELVLPPHANHHGNTFGGQIMAWMSKAARIAASAHGRAPVAVQTIEDVFFVGPSHVGDRVEVSARPIRCFGRTVEVALAVHAYGLNRHDRRLINRAYFVLEVVGRDFDFVLPDVEPTNESERLQYDLAVGRRALRLERFAVRSAETQRDSAWLFRDDLCADLCARNVTELLKVHYGKEDWMQIKNASNVDEVLVYVKEEGGLLHGKVTMHLPGVNAREVFDLLLDSGKRPQWDVFAKTAEKVAPIDKNNDVQRLVLQLPKGSLDLKNGGERMEEITSSSLSIETELSSNVSSPSSMEFILLRSWRRDNRRQLVIASHSIQHPSAPAEERGVPRGFVRSSGWIVERQSKSKDVLRVIKRRLSSSLTEGCSLTYIVGLGPSSSKIAKDVMLGRSKAISENMVRMAAMLKRK